MRVRVLGNSHVACFTGDPQQPNDQDTLHLKHGLHLRVRKLGSTGATIWGLRNENSTTRAGKSIREVMEFEPRQEATVVFLGDVDVREHLPKHAGGDQLILNIEVQSVIDKYVDFLKKFVVPHTDVLVLPAVVPLREVYYAERPLVREARTTFNDLLEVACKDEGWVFMDPSPFFLDDGKLPDELVRDDIHLEFWKVERIYNSLLFHLLEHNR